MKVALFFGSFNPIHIGHMAIANYIVTYAQVDQLWFVVSPQNPVKEKKTLLAQNHRLALVQQAIEDDERFRASNIEFALPQPSYTVNTLAQLSNKYPKYDFSLLLGADNLQGFNKWKNYELILSNYELLVYPRIGASMPDWLPHPNVKIVDAPIMEISATFIRKAIKEKKDIRHYLPTGVFQYIQEMHFYEK